MKKLLLATLVMISTSALADGNNSIGISYALRDSIAGDSDRPNRQGYNLVYAHKFNQNWAADINQQFRTERLNTEDGNNDLRLETGVTYTQPVVDKISVYTRGALGYRFTSTVDHTYYSVEPGVRFQATEPLNLRMGWRYRDSFNDTINFQTHTVRVAAEYALTKEDVLTVGVDRFYGDSQTMGYNLGYVHRF